MEYEEIKVYDGKNKGQEKKASKLGKLEFSLKAIDSQKFEMPMVCH